MAFFFEVGMVYSIAWQESAGEGALEESDPRRAVESYTLVLQGFWASLWFCTFCRRFVPLAVGCWPLAVGLFPLAVGFFCFGL